MYCLLNRLNPQLLPKFKLEDRRPCLLATYHSLLRKLTCMYCLLYIWDSYIQADPDLTFCYSTRENFFKGAGEVVDIRFSFDREGGFRGYGHVEFATVEDALKVHASLSLPCLFLSKCEKLPILSCIILCSAHWKISPVYACLRCRLLS